MKGTRSVYALQFLAPTPDGSTAWVTHLQTETEAWAFDWLSRLQREQPGKGWRWVLTAEDTCYKRVGSAVD